MNENNKYIIFRQECAAIVELPSKGVDWDGLYDSFNTTLENSGVELDRSFRSFAEACKLRETNRIGNAYFESELINGGINAVLIPMPESTEADLSYASEKLKRERDVVSLKVLKVDKWVDLPTPKLELSNEPEIEPLHVKGDCDVANLSKEDLQRLARVDGRLFAEGQEYLRFPNLRQVELIVAHRAANLEFPKLRLGSLYCENSRNLVFPSLECAPDIYAANSSGLECAKLTEARKFFIQGSHMAYFPKLSDQWHSNDFTGARNLMVSDELAKAKEIPNECLWGITWKGDCKAAELTKDQRERLIEVSGSLDCEGLIGEAVEFPRLEIVQGGLQCNESQGFHAPCLQTALGVVQCNGASEMTIPMVLALEKDIPVQCLSQATLEQAVQAEPEIEPAKRSVKV